MQNSLSPDLLVIRIDTDGTVPGEVLLEWASDVLSDLQTFEDFESHTILKIRHLGQGSPTILEVVFAGMVALGSLGGFAVLLSNYLKEAEGRAGPSTINIVSNYNATAVTYNCAALSDPIVVHRSELQSIEQSVGIGGGTSGRRSGTRSVQRPIGGVEIVHNDADPLMPGEEAKAREYVGEVHNGSEGLEFRLRDGRRAIIDGFAKNITVPSGQPVAVEATLRRGSRGGLADPRLIIWSWRRLDEGKAPPRAKEEKFAGQVSREYEKAYLGDTESEFERLSKKLNKVEFYPPLPEDSREIDAADHSTRGSVSTRTGTFHYADDGRLIFATDGLYGEARIRSGIPQPTVNAAYEAETGILVDPNSGHIFFAIDNILVGPSS